MQGGWLASWGWDDSRQVPLSWTLECGPKAGCPPAHWCLPTRQPWLMPATFMALTKKRARSCQTAGSGTATLGIVRLSHWACRRLASVHSLSLHAAFGPAQRARCGSRQRHGSACWGAVRACWGCIRGLLKPLRGRWWELRGGLGAAAAADGADAPAPAQPVSALWVHHWPGRDWSRTPSRHIWATPCPATQGWHVLAHWLQHIRHSCDGCRTKQMTDLHGHHSCHARQKGGRPQQPAAMDG